MGTSIRNEFVRAVALFVVSSLIVAATVRSRNAFGDSRQQSAAFCISSGGIEQDVISNDDGSNPMTVYCPIIDEFRDADAGTFGKTDVNTLNVYVYDGSTNSTTGSVVAQTCVAYATSVGASCDGMTDSTSAAGTGSGTLHPHFSTWTGNTTDFGYLIVTLPAYDGSVGLASALQGFYSST